jgi:hypothetical protein
MLQNDEDAVMAIQNGNQVRVFNRPCRVEQAKANRKSLHLPLLTIILTSSLRHLHRAPQ